VTAEEHAAALKLQALQRGIAVRQKYPLRKVATQSAVEAEPTPEVATADENRAATKIQAVARGRASRKQLAGVTKSPTMRQMENGAEVLEIKHHDHEYELEDEEHEEEHNAE
jgi:hypothetical protein